MNPSEIKRILADLGGGANKTLGQHFLIDKTALGAIVDAADIKKGDRVLEVGPGLGVLTKELVDRGAIVTVIEKDRRFQDLISPLIKGAGGISVLGDAAKLDWDKLMADKPWKFVSNLPYSITSLALRKALYAKNPPSAVVVLVQREVAERVLARDGKTSLLSLMVALASTDAKILRHVPPGAFYPPPKVDSAILLIRPKTQDEKYRAWGIESEEVMAVAKKGFAHPRKLLFRNLGLEEGMWIGIAEKIGCVVKTRAEDLSVEQWAELAKELMPNAKLRMPN